MEKRTGCLRCYTSRVENGHTVPSVETLEKYARALEIPIYRLFYEGEAPAQKLKVSKRPDSNEWGAAGKDHEELRRFAKLLARLDGRQRQILFKMALELAKRREGARRVSR